MFFFIKRLIAMASDMEKPLALITVESLLLKKSLAFTKPRFNEKDVNSR